MRGLGAPEMLMLLLVVGVPLFGAVDAAREPDAAFQAAGHNKALWVLLQPGGIFVCGVGFVASAVYFLAVRPTVVAAAS